MSVVLNLTWILLCIFISVFILQLSLLLQEESQLENEYSNNIECGFSSVSQIMMKFSNQFFMISVIFVIFDMELIIILPSPIFSHIIFLSLIIKIILSVLIISLLVEILNGLISWVK